MNQASPQGSKTFLATLAGFGAIILWSSSISFSRHLTEKLGFLTTGAVCNMLAGTIGTVFFFAREDRRRALEKASLLKSCLCGLLFLAYTMMFVAAVGLAQERRQVLEVGIINYLWPGLTLAFSIFILKTRAGFLLPLGLLLGFGGCVVALGFEGGLTMGDLRANVFGFGASLRANLASNALPDVLSLGNAIIWALYSNFTRRWLKSVPGGIVSLFMLATGVILLIPASVSAEKPVWTWATAGFLAGQVLGPSLAAYLFWERAMRWGHITLVNSAAFLIPILFLLVSSLVLQERPTSWLWIGAVLVVLGAVTCKTAIREP